MPEMPPRRKERTPLSPEELHYFIKLKKLKQVQKTEAFKATIFYKTFSYINIVLIGFVTYCVLSVLILTHWEKDTLTQFTSCYGEYNKEAQQRTITEINLVTKNNTSMLIKTSYLFQEPELDSGIYIAKDYLLRKVLKVKLNYDDRAFWKNETYPAFILCLFALLLSLYTYRFEKHLTANGLLTVFGLLFLSSIYFICV